MDGMTGHGKNNAKKATAPFHFPKNWATSPGFGV